MDNIINILYVCEDQYILKTDIEYIKYHQLVQNPNSIINIDQQLNILKKYDIIYLINCVDKNVIFEYIPYLKINSIIYINNLTKTEYSSIYSNLTSKNFTNFNMSYKKDSYQNYINLISKYNTEKSIIDSEINNGRKTTHWIWYVYPTTKKGINEPDPKTKIDHITAILLLNNTDWMATHKLIHNQIIKISHNKHSHNKLFPGIDIGRIKYFIQYMTTEMNTTMDNKYLTDLKSYIDNFYIQTPNGEYY